MSFHASILLCPFQSWACERIYAMLRCYPIFVPLNVTLCRVRLGSATFTPSGAESTRNCL